jgi:hypothetical protein
VSLALLVMGIAPSGRAGPDLAAARAAVGLIDRATAVQPGGRHHKLLRGLRHLRDPELKLLFLALSRHEHASLKMHGRLGLTELRTPQRLTASSIAQVEASAVQARLISAGLDDKLIQPKAMRAMLDWSGLGPA